MIRDMAKAWLIAHVLRRVLPWLLLIGVIILLVWLA